MRWIILLAVPFLFGGCSITALKYGHDDQGNAYFTTFRADGAGSLCFDELSGWGILVEGLGGGELICSEEGEE